MSQGEGQSLDQAFLLSDNTGLIKKITTVLFVKAPPKMRIFLFCFCLLSHTFEM